jgi:hypothetical protein
VKIANSIAKIAVLKTMAVTKVAVDAVFAVAPLTSDLQTSQWLRKAKGMKNTYMADGRKEGLIECGVGIYRR